MYGFKNGETELYYKNLENPMFLEVTIPETLDFSLQKVHLRCTASKKFFYRSMSEKTGLAQSFI